MSWDEARTEAELRRIGPLAIGLSVTSQTLELVEDWAARSKRVLMPDAPTVIVGGPHASFDPFGILKSCPSVDAVCRGEGEVIFPEMVRRISRRSSLSGLAGVVVRGDEPLMCHNVINRVPAAEFDALPFPRMSGLPVANYWAPDAKEAPLVTFMTARGCPFKCGFCSSPALLGREVRGWSVPLILDELERLVATHGVNEVSFVDDVFTVSPKRAIALCDGMLERGLGLSWFCNARADQVSARLAEAMAAAGCHQVYLGLESGSEEILKTIRKGATVPMLERGARLLKDAGISRSAGFVVGLPGEDDDTIGESIALAQRIKPERLQFTRWTPLAGSPLVEAGLGVPGRGFHDRETGDQISGWIERCYRECKSTRWGLPSW